ncbi:WcaI family glycosyltransferase [Mucilaginibacter sp. UYCu711]|uniref:WcaI family glycosyltransferase n=1 Tax=Mucilaginibacter sp. UYCu711 TaxID=3156339 RepID=UPI003D1B069F
MIEKNRILLMGHNFFPEPTGIGKYSGEMIEWLRKKDYNCTVVTTYPYYPYWKVQPPYKNGWYKKEFFSLAESGEKVTLYRCPLYVPDNLSGRNRILHDLSFSISMFFVILKLIFCDKSFDYIITVAPPFHIGYLALLYRTFRGGKLIYHIQDLQIEAAQQSNILKGNKLFQLLHKAEKVILKKSDVVSSISHGMINKIKSKVDRDIKFFPNWVETSQFFPIEDNSLIRQQWGFNKADFICLYSGSIGGKQGLENIIYAAELLKEQAHIKFVICGTGPYKKKLEEIVLEKKLDNISFVPLVGKANFNDFLNLADLHLIVQKAYIGDLVMPSKLQTILAVGGVSLITAEKDTSLYALVEKFKVGFIVDPDDHVKLAEKIIQASYDDTKGKRANAREYALLYLNIDTVMNRFVNDIAIDPKTDDRRLFVNI